MNTPDLLTPIYSHSFMDIPEWYFDVGLSKNVFVITPAAIDGACVIVPTFRRPMPFSLTVLKVVTYFTILIPLLVLVAKILVRSLMGRVVVQDLSSLKISNFSRTEIEELFPYEFKAQDVEGAKRSFSELSPDEVQGAIESGSLAGSYLLGLLSDEHLKALKLSKLSGWQIQLLFPRARNEEFEEVKRRFSCVSAEEVQASIENNKIASEYQMSLLSEGHLNALKVSSLSPLQVGRLFPDSYMKEKKIEVKARFACLRPEEVQAAIESNIISGEYLMSLLSDEHLNKLKLSRLTENQIQDLFSFRSPSFLENLFDVFLGEYKTSEEMLQEHFRRFKLLDRSEFMAAVQRGTIVLGPNTPVLRLQT